MNCSREIGTIETNNILESQQVRPQVTMSKINIPYFEIVLNNWPDFIYVIYFLNSFKTFII